MTTTILKLLLLQIHIRRKPTHTASISITNLDQRLLQKYPRTMRNHTIPLQLSKSQPIVHASSFNRLVADALNGATGMSVDFTIYHVFEALVGGGTQEDLSLEVFAGVAFVH